MFLKKKKSQEKKIARHNLKKTVSKQCLLWGFSTEVSFVFSKGKQSPFSRTRTGCQEHESFC